MPGRRSATASSSNWPKVIFKERLSRHLLLHVPELQGEVEQLPGHRRQCGHPVRTIHPSVQRAHQSRRRRSRVTAITAAATPAPNCHNNAILNPYYNMPAQPLLDKNAWYVTGLDYPYTSPNVFALVLNYKHNRFSITPAMTLNQGAAYGAPSDVQGLDPRTCTATQSSTAFTAATRMRPTTRRADLPRRPSGKLYIPNPRPARSIRSVSSRSRGSSTWACRCTTMSRPRVSAQRDGRESSSTHASADRARRGAGSTPPAPPICGYSPNVFYIATSTTARARTTRRPTACRSTRISRMRSHRRMATTTRSTIRCRSICTIQLQLKI